MTTAAALAVPSAEETSYTLHAPEEIAACLRAIAREALLVSVFFGTGEEFALTTVLGVDVARGELYLEPPREPARRDRLLAASSALVCASKQGVLLKFSIARLRPALWAGAHALAAPLPAALVRLQRRENYRVACPLLRPLHTTVTLESAAGPLLLECPVLDLSCGGLALEMPPQPPPVPGARLRPCALVLPEGVRVEFELEVRSVAPAARANRLRAGCRFLGLSPAGAAALQRYIFALERARAARFGRV